MPGIARVDAREPLDSRGEMVVRIRPIDDPPTPTPAVARRVAEAPVIVRRIGVLQTNEIELRVTNRNVHAGRFGEIPAPLRERNLR